MTHNAAKPRLFLALAITVGVGAGPGTGALTEPADAARAAAIKAAANHCPAVCVFCFVTYMGACCFENGYFQEMYSCGLPNCDPDPCDLVLTPQQRGEAIVLGADGSAAEIESILKRYHGEVFLNRERRSIQIRGCGGAIIANLPLKGEQLRVLNE